MERWTCSDQRFCLWCTAHVYPHVAQSGSSASLLGLTAVQVNWRSWIKWLDCLSDHPQLRPVNQTTAPLPPTPFNLPACHMLLLHSSVIILRFISSSFNKSCHVVSQSKELSLLQRVALHHRSSAELSVFSFIFIWMPVSKRAWAGWLYCVTVIFKAVALVLCTSVSSVCASLHSVWFLCLYMRVRSTKHSCAYEHVELGFQLYSLKSPWRLLAESCIFSTADCSSGNLNRVVYCLSLLDRRYARDWVACVMWQRMSS